MNHYTETNDFIMRFGKYKGWRLSEIDDSYITWLAGLPNLREPLASAVAAEYQRRHSQEAEEAYERWQRTARQGRSQPEYDRPPARTKDLIESGFRALAKVCHPDCGGTNDQMRQVIAARSWLLKQVSVAEVTVQ